MGGEGGGHALGGGGGSEWEANGMYALDGLLTLLPPLSLPALSSLDIDEDHVTEKGRQLNCCSCALLVQKYKY